MNTVLVRPRWFSWWLYTLLSPAHLPRIHTQGPHWKSDSLRNSFNMSPLNVKTESYAVEAGRDLWKPSFPMSPFSRWGLHIQRSSGSVRISTPWCPVQCPFHEQTSRVLLKQGWLKAFRDLQTLESIAMSMNLICSMQITARSIQLVNESLVNLTGEVTCWQLLF